MGRVNMYTYVAASNPYFAKSLAHKYGYEFDKDQRLDTVLQQLVSYEGEPALMEIVENHPDKELFLEYYNKKTGEVIAPPRWINQLAKNQPSFITIAWICDSLLMYGI